MPVTEVKLNPNLIQQSLVNMIISQDVIGGSIKANYNLVDKARVDGTLYGDTKMYIDTPTLESVDWVQDSEEATNLLKLHRPKAPKMQLITLDKFRQVALTKDDYMSKQAFGTEGVFTAYQSIIEGRLSKTKEVYDNTTYDAFFGTVKPVVEKTIKLSDFESVENLEAKARLRAQAMAKGVADLIADMKDYGYEYTANGFLRAFGEDEIKVVWNVDYINEISKFDLPTIYHKDGLVDKFGGDVLPARFFGNVNADATAGTEDKTVRSLIEQYITTGSKTTHYWPGEAIATTDTAPAGTSYTVDSKVICKVYTKLPPYMSAFTASSSFWNARNLSTNLYLTWGHNTLAALESEALVTVKEN